MFSPYFPELVLSLQVCLSGFGSTVSVSTCCLLVLHVLCSGGHQCLLVKLVLYRLWRLSPTFGLPLTLGLPSAQVQISSAAPREPRPGGRHVRCLQRDGAGGGFWLVPSFFEGTSLLWFTCPQKMPRLHSRSNRSNESLLFFVSAVQRHFCLVGPPLNW